MSDATGTIFNIQRFCTQDGPGIRTTVFVKGCPLRCAWCHNPESHRIAPEVMFSPEKCIGCGDCAAMCEKGLHSMTGGMHGFDRRGCGGCGKCAEACCTGALELCGYAAAPQEVLATVLRDREFYKNTGGGMTLSGGEPLAQPAFTLALLKAAKAEGLHICMETCGYGDPAVVKEAAQYTDLFLFDCKLTDAALHKQYTGVDNTLILQNLAMLNELGAHIVLRCPILPDVNLNDAHFDGIAVLAERYGCIEQIDLEPYHPLGISKSERLGRAAAYDRTSLLERSELEPFAQKLREQLSVPVNIQ
ncbi:MAG: glycyl-radical enzyme activating protein [Oscillospiraceae bacterium]|nr:glycyl-radical enzyme activating protein [Oscillospiraceae bacterium]